MCRKVWEVWRSPWSPQGGALAPFTVADRLIWKGCWAEDLTWAGYHQRPGHVDVSRKSNKRKKQHGEGKHYGEERLSALQWLLLN